MTAGLQVLVIVLCLAGAWFFSGIETGLVSINRLRLQYLVRRKVPGADVLQWFLRNPDALLGTTLVGTNVSVTVASTLAVEMAADAFGPAGSLAAGVILTLVLLTFCEYFPKAWYQSFPALRSLPFAPLLKQSRRVLSPISIPLMFAVRHLLPFHRPERDRIPLITREELVHLAKEGQTSGILTPAEHRMIHEVMQLTAKTARELMTPRDRMVFVPEDLPVPELLELARAREVSRFPVYHSAQRAFTGIVHIFDVLADPARAGKRAADFMRKPQFVADYTPVDNVLPRMRVVRQPLVLVTDERHEVIGLLTLEDVLDEVVGAL